MAILGPTGSGKSDLALAVAGEFNGEVVNCDSLQIYRHFDIGTAKLPPGERSRIPHHLIDILDPDRVFTAGEYARQARAVLREISARGRLPVLAGGTGFYFRALLDGLFPGPQRDDALRARLIERQKRRSGSLHNILRRFDPEAARRIHANDVPKTVRALEVCLLARRPVTELFASWRDSLRGYAVLKIGLSPGRSALYERLDRRCAAMFASGLVEEVQRIFTLGYPATSKPFESHGYKQVVQMLKGELTPEQAISEAQKNTRRYAKRQMTWFRREPEVEWFEGFGDEPRIRHAVLERVREFV